MKNLINKNLNGRNIFVLFILTNIVYAIMLTITIPWVMSFSGGMKLLDMMPGGYHTCYVNLLMNTLGEKGRDAYLFYQIPLDLIYPFLFAVSYSLVFAWFLRELSKSESPLFYFCLLPIFAGFFDYCENIGIITIIHNYPDNSDILTKVTSGFSVLKSIFTTLYFVGLIITLTVYARNRLFEK